MPWLLGALAAAVLAGTAMLADRLPAGAVRSDHHRGGPAGGRPGRRPRSGLGPLGTAALVGGLAVCVMPALPALSLRLAAFEPDPLPTTTQEIAAVPAAPSMPTTCGNGPPGRSTCSPASSRAWPGRPWPPGSCSRSATSRPGGRWPRSSGWPCCCAAGCSRPWVSGCRCCWPGSVACSRYPAALLVHATTATTAVAVVGVAAAAAAAVSAAIAARRTPRTAGDGPGRRDHRPGADHRGDPAGRGRPRAPSRSSADSAAEPGESDSDSTGESK